MRLRNFLYLIVLFAVVFTGCSKFSKVLKSKDVDYKLKMADLYFEQKKYAKAQILYQELFQVKKGTHDFENIYYKSAYCYFYDEFYDQAEAYFRGFLEVFPNSPKAEEIDFMRCMSFYKQSPTVELEQVNTTKSVGLFQSFINRHPSSTRIQEANDIIDACRNKLESKDYRACELYYNLGQYKAAAVAYTNLLVSYPESTKGEEYKYKAVKAYFKYAKLSVAEKQVERFEKVIDEYRDFADRFPESKLLKDAEAYYNQSINSIKVIKNEQTTSSARS